MNLNNCRVIDIRELDKKINHYERLLVYYYSSKNVKNIDRVKNKLNALKNLKKLTYSLELILLRTKLEVIKKIFEISNLEGDKYTDGQILDMILDYCEEEKNKIEQL